MLHEFAPRADEILTKEQMMPDYRYQRDDGSIREDAEDRRIYSIDQWRAFPPLQTDWWIVWPRLFLEKPKVVFEVPPEWK